MFDNYIISDKHFRNFYEKGEPKGFIICARINYYRGIPLSMLHDLKVVIDGVEYTTDVMTFVMDNRKYSFKEINEKSDSNWHFGDELIIEVSKPGGLTPGKKTVEMYLAPRNSYFGVFEAYSRREMTFA